jgi:hypothetical protein
MFNVFKMEASCGQCYLDELFKLHSNPLKTKLSELCFAMFSLYEFKVWLCDRVFTAYNTVPDFEVSPFHSLLSQVILDEPVMLEMSQRFRNTLCL